jgi:non-ribosomal peptide synthetase component F
VSLGITTSGRKADLLGIETISGPTFATVPVVVRLDPSDTKDVLLHKILDQSIEQTEYEQYGLEHIRDASPEAKDACAFQTLVVVQPVESSNDDQENSILRDISLDQPDINTHPLNIECQLTASGLVMKAGFDTQVISEFNVSHLLSQFCHVMRQLCSLNECTVKEITTTSPQDIAQIASWNRDLPQSVEACVHDLVLEKCIYTPAAQAVCAWDGDLTYAQLEEHSRLVGLHLQQEENLICGDIVHLLLDK